MSGSASERQVPTNFGHKLVRRNGLHQVSLSPEVKPVMNMERIGVAAQEDKGDVVRAFVSADGFQRKEPVGARQM